MEIVKFLENSGYPYFIEDIVKCWGDSELEYRHNYIQWIFPLKERSLYNPDAPVLTDLEIAIIKNDWLCQNALTNCYLRFIDFLGLAYDSNRKVYAYYDSGMFDMENHNWLRITRCLKSLTILGMKDRAEDLFNYLQKNREQFNVPPETWKFWYDALTST